MHPTIVMGALKAEHIVPRALCQVFGALANPAACLEYQ